MTRLLDYLTRALRARPPRRTAIDAARLEDRLMLSAAPLADAAVDPHAVEETAPAWLRYDSLDSPVRDNGGENDGADDGASDNARLGGEFRFQDAPRGAGQPQLGSVEQSAKLELVFVDTGAADYQQLVDDLLANAAPDREFKVHLLWNSQDGVSQISETLAAYTSVDAIHLVSHGAAGQVKLGSTWLSLDNLEGYAGELAGWNASLRDGGDLLIYGCELAATADGRALTAALGALCNCDVAASVDDTGHAAQGGDWDLEYATGEITTTAAFSGDLQQRWSHALALQTVRDNFSANSWSNDDGSALWTGPWIENDTWIPGPAAGNIKIDALSNLRIKTWSASESLLREVDLSGAATATLTYDVHSVLIGDTVRVEVSGDGGGSWTPLIDYTSVVLTSESFDITPYVAPDTQIRIRSLSNGNDTIYFDNIQIEFDQVQAPGGVRPNLDLWLRANAGIGAALDGNPVTQWNDQSASLNHALSAGSDPTFRDNATDNVNFNPIIQFNNTGAEHLSLNGALLPTADAPRTYFVVARAEGSPDPGSALYHGNSGGANLGDSVGFTISATTFSLDSGGSEYGVAAGAPTSGIYTARLQNPPLSPSTGDYELFLDGQPLTASFLSGSSQSVTTAADFAYVGAGNSSGAPSNFWNGGIAEVIVYDAALSAADRLKVESYLAVKYGVTLDQTTPTDYQASDGTTIWDASGNATYSNDIAGIGRDSESSLNQTQSKSINSDAVVTVSSASDQQNLEFLLWGNDGAALSEIAGEPSAVTTRLARAWRVAETGEVGAATISFDLTGLTYTGTTAADFRLIVDSDTDFSSGATLIAAASFDAGAETVTFTGVNLDDGEFFSLGTSAPPATLVVDTTADYASADARYGDTSSIAALLADKGSDNRISLREAIEAANNSTNGAAADKIHFNIPDSDARHYYYRDDGIAGSLSLVAATTLNDGAISDFDPDYPYAAHSWFSINVNTSLPELTITDTVTIDGHTQSGAAANTLSVGDNASLKIELTSNGGGGLRGLVVDDGADGSSIFGLAINNFTWSGIIVEPGADGVTIQGNFLGVDIAGFKDVGNGDSGVQLRSSNSLIGGPNAADRNLVSGNNGRGVVTYTFGPIESGNIIQNNYIGVDATGLRAIANDAAGIQVWNQNGLQIRDNVISGNDGIGIWLRDGSTKNNTLIQGNLVGLGADGATVVANNGDGIRIHNGAVNTLIGGVGPGEGNVIAGNTGRGIYSLGNTADATSIVGNSIGVDAYGSARGNGNDGIRIDDNSDNNLIGGLLPSAGNIIANNNGDGLLISSGLSTGNAILGNSFYGNADLGIDLDGDNATDNDDGDIDGGTNNRQNFPVLTRAVTDGANVTISGWLNSAASSPFRLEFFLSDTADPTGYGEGATYIGFATVATDANGVAFFSQSYAHSVAPGQVITSTATDAGNNTSEFSIATAARAEAVTVNGLWLSTETDVDAPSGAPGLTAWSEGEALSFGGPSLALAPNTTTGAFASALNLDLLGDGDVDIDALHYVTRSVTVGSGLNSINLNPGDILLSTADDEVFYGGTFSVEKNDLFVLRPVAPGEYSVGSLELVLDLDSPPLSLPTPDPDLSFGQLRAISLIEQNTVVGGVALSAGDFLFARDGGGDEEDIFLFHVTDAGQGVTDGTADRLIEGTTLGISNQIFGIELIESPILVGGVNLSAGEILLTLSGDTTVLDADADPMNDLTLTRHDIFRVTISQTELNGGTLAAAASLLFRGLDVGLNDSDENLDALTIAANTPGNMAPSVANLAGDTLAFSEGDGATVIEQGGDVMVTDGDSPDFDGGNLTVSIVAGGDAAEDILSIRNQGMGGGQVGFDGANVYFGGVLVGSAAGGSGGADLVVALNGNATAAAADALIKNVTYDNSDAANPTTTPRSIRYTLDDGDGGGSVPLHATVNVAAINDAPSLDNSGAMTLSGVGEDDPGPAGDTVATIVATAGGDRITDADSGAVEGLAVIGVDDANGLWQFDAGSGWTAFGAVSDNAAVLLDAGDRIRFVPNPDYNGPAGNLTFRAWDQTDGNPNGATGVDVSLNGGATAYSSATETAALNVLAVNDAPSLDNSGAMTLSSVGEDDSAPSGDTVAAIVATAGGDRITDADSGAVEGLAVIGVDNANGLWQYDAGSGWTAFGTVSDNAAVLLDAADRIRFVPNPDYNGSAGNLTFRAWDQTDGNPKGATGVDVSLNGAATAYSAATATAGLNVLPVNDAPSLDNSGAMTLSSVGEDDSAPSGDTVAAIVATAGGDRITDADSGAVEGLAVIGVDNANGLWQFDAGSGWTAFGAVSDNAAVLLDAGDRIRFVPNPDYNGPTGNLTFRAWDQTDGNPNGATGVDVSLNGGATAYSSATATAALNVLPVNDAPTITSLSGDTLAYSVGLGPLVVEQSEDAMVADLDSTDFDGGNLTVAVAAGADPVDDALSVRNEGSLAGQIGFVAGNVYYSGVMIGAASGGGGGVDLVVTLNSNATAAAVSALVRNVTYENTDLVAPTVGTRTVRFSIDDGDGGVSLNHDTLVTVSAAAAPTIVGLSGDALAYSEGDGQVGIEQGADAAVSDLDSADFETGNLTVTIVAGGAAAEDVLSVRHLGNGGGQIGFDGAGVFYEGTLIGVATGGSGGASLIVTFNASATPAATAALIQSIAYENIDYDAPTVGVRTVRFTVDDGDGAISSTHDVLVSVAAVNDAASLFNIETAPLNRIENDVAVAVSDAIQISDVDDASLESATIRFTTGYVSGEDSLAFVDTPTIVGSWNAIAGELTLTGNDTLGNYQAALRAVTFQNTSDNPAPARTVEFTVSDGDSFSNSLARNIQIAAVNDAAILANIESAALPFTENDPATAITGSITISDADDSNIESATIQFSAGYVYGEDLLAFSDTPTIAGSWNATSGTLTLTGADTLANYQSALRAVTYRNTSDHPVTLSRTVRFAVSDGDGFSPPQSRGINVAGVNDAPAAGNDAYNVDANGALLVGPGAGVLHNDVDAEGDPLNAVLVSGPSRGALVLNADGSFLYTPHAGATGSDHFTYQALDGSGGADVASVTLAIRTVGGPLPPATRTAPTPPADAAPDSDAATAEDFAPSALVAPAAPPTPQAVNAARAQAAPPRDVVSTRAAPPASLRLDSPAPAEFPPYEPPATPPRSSAEAPRPDPAATQEVYTPTYDFVSLTNDLADLKNDLQDAASSPFFTAGAAASATSMLTVGYVVWTIRSGWLVTSLLAQMPAWRLVDPLVVLNYLDEESDESDESDDSLQSLLEKDHSDHSDHSESQGY